MITKPGGASLKTYEVVEQVEKMAELARMGQDFLEATAYFSEATIKAMVNDLSREEKIRLMSRWPSSMFAAINQ